MAPYGSLAVLWRQRVVIAVVFISCMLAGVVLSTALPKVYSARSTLLVTVPGGENRSFDAVQASQTVAHTYAVILKSRTVSGLVARRLGDGSSPGALKAAIDARPQLGTQLLTIEAEASSARKAQRIANAYAGEFTAFAGRHLTRTTDSRITVAEPAVLPSSPARPRPVLYLLALGLFGLALGVGLAFLRQRLDHRLRSLEDVETQLDLPVLARVPVRGNSDGSAVAFGEAFHVLRTNLRFARPWSELGSIAVTSAGASEGKTTASIQLAVASQQVGLDVVLVEADLRRPSLHERGLPATNGQRRAGLVDYLIGAVELDDVLEATEWPPLRVIPAGPVPPSPPPLLESPRGRELVGELLERCDLVVVDCPHVSAGADASLIARWVDGVVLVVDLKRSTSRSVQAALTQLDAVQAEPLGLVLNRDRGAGGRAYPSRVPRRFSAENDPLRGAV
jgi:succinoglycan biosynthesis transport protein ExoP